MVPSFRSGFVRPNSSDPMKRFGLDPVATPRTAQEEEDAFRDILEWEASVKEPALAPGNVGRLMERGLRGTLPHYRRGCEQIENLRVEAGFAGI